MKVVILAAGLGTRLNEETGIRPKQMVDIGEKLIRWHIMKIDSGYGFHEFIVCLGYKGYVIKELFANYFLHKTDLTIDLRRNKTEIHQNHTDPWQVTLANTGDKTMTGGRLRRIREYLNHEPFMVTYDDGVTNSTSANCWPFTEVMESWQ